jgi:hypothetical protein
MRRAIVVVLTALLMGSAVAAHASSTEHIKDQFTSISWGGSDGSLPWSGSWQENGDDGDEKQGNVRVVSSGNCASGNCIRIGGLLSGHGASRSAPTGSLGDLTLRYDLRNVVTLLPLGLTSLQVQVRGDGGWETVATHNLGSNFSGGFDYEGIDAAGELDLRFTITGLTMTSEVYIDNVEIVGVLIEEEPTTTTTTTPLSESTTTTVAPTTTTGHPATTTATDQPASTTTTKPRTTTTADRGSTTSTTEATSSTERATTSTTPAGDDDGDSPSSSPVGSIGTGGPGSGGSGDGGSAIGPEGSGIRAAATGLQASFQGDLYGEVRTVSSLGGVDLQADYNMAVEVIKASWAWVILLGLIIAWALVTGLDRRREPVAV